MGSRCRDTGPVRVDGAETYNNGSLCIHQRSRRLNVSDPLGSSEGVHLSSSHRGGKSRRDGCPVDPPNRLSVGTYKDRVSTGTMFVSKGEERECGVRRHPVSVGPSSTPHLQLPSLSQDRAVRPSEDPRLLTSGPDPGPLADTSLFGPTKQVLSPLRPLSPEGQNFTSSETRLTLPQGGTHVPKRATWGEGKVQRSTSVHKTDFVRHGHGSWNPLYPKHEVCLRGSQSSASSHTLGYVGRGSNHDPGLPSPPYVCTPAHLGKGPVPVPNGTDQHGG